MNVVLAFRIRCPWISLGGMGQAERSDDIADVQLFKSVFLDFILLSYDDL